MHPVCGPCARSSKSWGRLSWSRRRQQQSAAGHSITLLTPLLVQEVIDDANQPMGWAVEGRPADCVKLGLLELLKEPPD